jgi:membrane protease YdiL (CAAX protease family)
MTAAEHHFLLLALAWILGSVPLALLAWQVWFRPRPRHAVIPHEDTLPAGSFLDVSLPPPLPAGAGESGIPLRQWKAVDGWVALGTVLLLSLLMGPLAIDPESAKAFELSPKLMSLQLAFQLGMGGLLLFYLKTGRGFNLVRIFGLKRQPLPMVPLWALGWILPGTIAILVLTGLTLPFVLKLLGLKEASPQMIVTALQATPDALTKWLAVLSVGIGAPFMEELIFRGFLYSVARRYTHWSYAALGSSLFFGVVHANAMSLLPLTCLGLLFAAAYEQSKNLLVPMCMHGAFNLCQVALMFNLPEITKHLEKLPH